MVQRGTRYFSDGCENTAAGLGISAFFGLGGVNKTCRAGCVDQKESDRGEIKGEQELPLVNHTTKTGDVYVSKFGAFFVICVEICKMHKKETLRNHH